MAYSWTSWAWAPSSWEGPASARANALELIMRGHRLVVDDAVHVKKIGAIDLYGEAPEMIKSLLEIRGVGIVDIRHLFGVSAVLDKKKIDLVIDALPIYLP